MSHQAFGEEARKCIEIHSHLSTCLYNWAVGHTLYEQQVLCWSTTVSYYAMMHSARTLFSLIEFDPRFQTMFSSDQTKQQHLRQIMKYHSQFCLFLQSQSRDPNEIKLLDESIQCLHEYFPKVDWPSFLSVFGHVLELHKEAREAENYEHFVVAHHGRDYHFESPFLDICFSKSEEHANKHIPQILNQVLRFYQQQTQMRDYHLSHLRNEVWWLEKTIEKEKLVMPIEMIGFLKAIKDLTKAVRIPVDYMNFEQEMDMKNYTTKGEVYQKLANLSQEIARM